MRNSARRREFVQESEPKMRVKVDTRQPAPQESASARASQKARRRQRPQRVGAPPRRVEWKPPRSVFGVQKKSAGGRRLRKEAFQNAKSYATATLNQKVFGVKVCGGPQAASSRTSGSGEVPGPRRRVAFARQQTQSPRQGLSADVHSSRDSRYAGSQASPACRRPK